MATVISGQPGEAPAAPTRRIGGSEWVVLAALGAAFALVSLFDVALTFYPVSFGDAGWEFGTATSVLDNLPLALVGIGLVAVAGIGRRSVPLAAAARVIALVLGVVLLLVALMFVRNLGEGMRAVTEPTLRQGLKESILRTAVQLVAYLGALGWIAFRARTES